MSRAKTVPSINIEKFNGRLRLRWTVGSRRYCLSTGLEDSPNNRIKAGSIALQVQADIVNNRFDNSLLSYKEFIAKEFKNKNINLAKPSVNSALTITKLFSAWIQQDRRFVQSNTLEKDRKALTLFVNYFGDIPLTQIDDTAAAAFAEDLLSKFKKSTVRTRLLTLSRFYKWGIKKNILTKNPWTEIIGKIKSIQWQPPKPFTVDEIQLILNGFKQNAPELYLLTFFLFLTGLRIGEALALTWENIKADLSTITIARQWVNNSFKPPKNNKTRIIKTSDSIKQILLELKDKNPFLVFFPGHEPPPSQYFYSRWKKILKILNIPYRKPHAIRATVVSTLLDQGVNPLEIAEFTGHNVNVMFTHYSQVINRRPLEISYERQLSGLNDSPQQPNPLLQ